MKITPATLVEMRTAIEPLDIADVRNAYRTGQYPRAEVTKDVDRRYRWDLLHAALGSAWICDRLYGDEGANDTHVDTALRAIVAPL